MRDDPTMVDAASEFAESFLRTADFFSEPVSSSSIEPMNSAMRSETDHMNILRGTTL